ncbi:MAG: hypothetical protein ABW175_09175 [Bradyrhizobium sp.]
MRIILIALSLFAIYVPLAWLLHRNYIDVPRPVGAVVEIMYWYNRTPPDHYSFRSYAFQPEKMPDVSSVVVYEDMMPLPRQNYQLVVHDRAYVVKFRASDDSDPRTNGRRYWTVMPK